MPPFLAASRTHALPKRGHTEDEYEDATVSPVVATDGTVRAAIADGATEAAFAGAWARTLVEEFVGANVTVPETFAESLHRTRRVFGRRIAEHATALPWYVAAKAEEGALATFLGLVIYPNGAWRAVAVGDCCLFHLRGDTRLTTWPLTDAAAFDNQPALVNSRLDTPEPTGETMSSQWSNGDRFLLASDALAAYLLAHGPAEVIDIDDAAFADFVERARDEGMRNDDVTLVEIVLQS